MARMPTRLQSCSASDRMCELKSTVRPSSRNRKISSRTSRRPIGSSPDIGSSSMMNSGSFTSACASPTRWTMPFEYSRSRPAPIGAQADQIEHARHARAARLALVAEEAGEVRDELLSGQVVVERRILGQEAEAAVRADVARRTAEHFRLARRRLEQADEQLERGALAGAVGTEQAEDAARRESRTTTRPARGAAADAKTRWKSPSTAGRCGLLSACAAIWPCPWRSPA